MKRSRGGVDSGQLVGVLHVVAGGMGYVDYDEAEDGVRVEPAFFGGAIDGDKVRVQVLPARGSRKQGRIVAVESRGRSRLTGLLSEDGTHLIPDDPRAPIALLDKADSKARLRDQVLLCEIVHYPVDAGDSVRVHLVQVLGQSGELETELAKALASRGVVEEFSDDVLSEADQLPRALQPKDYENRVDLRQVPFVTIDPPTARDFDDAVAIEQRDDGGVNLWIAVADVSHYVRPSSAIEREGYQRACSIYLPDRAIPMLPEALSSHLCSLVPLQDRLAMVVALQLDAKLVVRGTQFMQAVIHSQARLDYPGVAAVLQGDLHGSREGYRPHLPMLQLLSHVAQVFRARRMKRGSLDLELPEAHIVLDEDDPRLVRDIITNRPDPGVVAAYNLIEEYMLAANEAVGQLFAELHLPTLWRVHPPPNVASLEKLAEVLNGYGERVTAERMKQPKGMAAVLKRVQSHPAARPLSYLCLRALKQACYHVQHQGHFGLASEAYVHFTSPIRRYPDVVVHRQLKELMGDASMLDGGNLSLATVEKPDWTPDDFSEAAMQSSMMERRALEIEREVRSIYAAHFMRDRIGDEFEGTIVSMASFGFFVALDNPQIEGMVKLSALSDRIEFDPIRVRMYAKRSQRQISLGDRLLVRIAGADVAKHHVDLDVVAWMDARQ